MAGRLSLASPHAYSSRLRHVLVVSRFRVPEPEGERFRIDLEAAHDVLSTRTGFVEGRIGRNLDDPTLWVLTTTWENVGAYRRALSSYEVKLGAVPLLSRAIDEPSAYEPVERGVGLDRLDRRGTDADRRGTDSTRSIG
ncbi:MAG: Antibiotic biosynthesis monooxygenase [Nocardioides sp.]|nr:Antibiotic biosynthesis monooxygenase [Nocardioides sp.]